MLDVDSQTLAPLPDVLSHGLVAVSTFGLLSFFCSTSLFFFLTWRLISWRPKNEPDSPPNQFLLLIYNLLLADMQQAVAFLLNITALRNNGIYVGTPTCFAQGWFVSTGDLASSVFICAIACHTWMGVVKEYRLPTPAFYCCIGALWTFVYIMAAIGPIIHGRDFYVRASAWVCYHSPTCADQTNKLSAGSTMPSKLSVSGSTTSGSFAPCSVQSSSTCISSPSSARNPYPKMIPQNHLPSTVPLPSWYSTPLSTPSAPRP